MKKTSENIAFDAPKLSTCQVMLVHMMQQVCYRFSFEITLLLLTLELPVDIFFVISKSFLLPKPLSTLVTLKFVNMHIDFMTF